MKPSVTIALLLLIGSLSSLVLADLLSVVTLTFCNVTNHPNDYFGEISHEILKGKKSSLLSMELPMKKDLPETMEMRVILKLNGQEPIDWSTSLCEGLKSSASNSFTEAGIPKETFPKACPIMAGDWSVVKWDPPVYQIPPGVPDGPISGSVTIADEGKSPCFQFQFEGEVTHDFSGLGP